MGNICRGQEPHKLNGEAPMDTQSNNHLTNGSDRVNGSHQINSHELTLNGRNSQEQSLINGNTSQNNQEMPTISIPSGDNFYYKMDNPHRGLAIIFNHYKYKCDRRDPREGTKYDKQRLVEVLNNLNFEVHNHKDDLTFDQILQVLKEVQNTNHADKDCLVLAVLTHGDIGGWLSAADIDYSFSALWEPFTDENCPSLKGKPRLFFVQACRGNNVMSAIELIHQTETDDVPYKTTVPNIPEHFLVAYATCEGYFSWRTLDEGSWFIQSLCRQIEKNAYNNDINYILTKVLHDVAVGYQSIVPDFVGMHEKKQMPCIITKLNRLLLFKEKLQK